MELHDDIYLIIFCFLLDNVGQKKTRHIHFKGIRHDTINVKKIKNDVNVSETYNPVNFYGRFQLWNKNIQSLFLTMENV